MSTERELSWDDSIENDGGDFVVLPAGEYNFRVVKFERGRHQPKQGGKLPSCPKAILTIEVDGGMNGSATWTENLFLHTKTEGILCSFFRSIGQRKAGEKLTMDWGQVTLATGRVKVKVDSWPHKTDKNADGTPKKMEANRVDRWLDPDEAPATQPVVAEEPTGFVAGKF